MSIEKLYHNTSIELFKPLLKVIDYGLQKRYHLILNLEDSVFAIISISINPYFKIKWITIKKKCNN